jgi:hypothetical protein
MGASANLSKTQFMANCPTQIRLHLMQGIVALTALVTPVWQSGQSSDLSSSQAQKYSKVSLSHVLEE